MRERAPGVVWAGKSLSLVQFGVEQGAALARDT